MDAIGRGLACHPDGLAGVDRFTGMTMVPTDPTRSKEKVVSCGRLLVVVDGRNGENRIRVEGATSREAGWRAVEAAAAEGVLADRTWPSPGKVGQADVAHRPSGLPPGSKSGRCT